MSKTWKKRVVTRKPIAIVLTVLVPGALAVYGLGATLGTGLVHNLADALVFSLILGGSSFVIWLLAWHSKIRATPDALFVDNFLVVHEVPWPQVKEIVLENGILVVLDDDTVIGSLQFGGSVLGGITGYRTFRRPLRRLQQALATYKHAGTTEACERRTYVKFPWIAALAWFLLYAIPSFLQL
ncbi:hypothetical protein [Planotetraspora sp. GP83]|uniref:hypothetical protein n=1 Tax=Planotetraspora sp. GP83 TaxID=3156264 RepID=UPI0035118779